MKKIMLVFGTRPEAIKMCPLVKALERDERFEPIVCVTAQHREMLDSVLAIFDVQPHYDLNLMSHGQTIIDIASKVMYGVDKILKEVNPDIVLVHGDTSTTLNAAQAAFYNKIPVGHVEAGLRSGNIYSPYPEEFNRKLVGTFAEYHFSPTKGNIENLLKEGVSEDKIYLTGNTVIDALLEVSNREYEFKDETLKNIDFDKKKVILLTCHRRENWGQPMKEIFEAVKEIVLNNEDVEVVFPVHMNPMIRELSNEILGDLKAVHLIEPQDYEPFVNLISKSYLIMTDSGGIQEEAPALGKPVVVLRVETERPEAVEAGTVEVVGVDKNKIIEKVNELLTNKEKYNEMANAVNPYGDGNACGKILEVLKREE